MSHAENLQTVENFVDNGWRQTPKNQLKKELKSVFKETNRLIDNWPYFYDENGIFVEIEDEKTKKINKSYVKDLIKRDSYPESAEGLIFDQLQSWIPKTDEGVAVWISPRYPGKYPCSKIIIHQIAYEFGTMRKSILNSTVPFDSSPEKTLQMIHRLFPETEAVKTIEELRSVLLFPGENFHPEILISEIGKLDKNVLNAEMALTEGEIEERAGYVSNLVHSGASSRFIGYEMQRLGLVGKFSISCPPSQQGFAESISALGGVEDNYGSLKFSCPHCHQVNTRPYGRLISNCQHCGGNVSC